MVLLELGVQRAGVLGDLVLVRREAHLFALMEMDVEVQQSDPCLLTCHQCASVLCSRARTVVHFNGKL